MKLVIGLGNPGRKYDRTRHNVGFEVLAKLAEELIAPSPRVKFEGEMTEAVWGTEKILLLWPHTYMNQSGRSVRRAIDFYKLDAADFLVVCDDMNLPAGRLRIRPSGSAGGQKGLSSIIQSLGTDQFARLRIGIDRPPPGWQTTDYVLGQFDDDQRTLINAAIDDGVATVKDWATLEFAEVMSRHNAAKSPKQSGASRDDPSL